MATEIPEYTPEQHEAIPDNARKFVLQPVGPSFFENIGKKTFTLFVDWLSTSTDSEEKLARKVYEDGTIEILRIAKVVDEEGKRRTVKTPISEEEYQAALVGSVKHLEKVRTEFTYTQGDVSYPAKYDVFTGTTLVLLEVEDEDKEPFQPNLFPSELREVSTDADYSGYRICETLEQYR